MIKEKVRKVVRVGVDSITGNYKNLDEAAKYLHFSENELRRLLREKKIRVVTKKRNVMWFFIGIS